jgi:tetratricopeptide (TPR) repeat protein
MAAASKPKPMLSVLGCCLAVAAAFPAWNERPALLGAETSCDADSVESAAGRGDFATAHRLLRREFTEHLHTAASCLQAARIARRAEEFRDAELWLNEAARHGAAAAEVAFERLRFRAQSGYAHEVHPLLAERLAKRDGDAALAWESLGRGYLRAYRLSEAGECFDEVLKFHPDALPGLLGRAETLRQYPHTSRGPAPARLAADDLRRVVAIAPCHFRARVMMAEGLVGSARDSELREAEGHIRAVLAHQPNDAAGQTLLAQILIDQERWDEARRLLDRVVADSPNFLPALRMLADLAYRTRDYPGVARWDDRVLQVNPRDRAALYRTASRLIHAGRKEEGQAMLIRFREVYVAELEFDKLRRLMVRNDPGERNDADVRYKAGRAALRMGRTEDARLWYQRALLEDPCHAAANRALDELSVTASPNAKTPATGSACSRNDAN